FCQLPTDATLALFNLERAHQLDFPNPAVNIHNRIICHISLSQERIARNLAEEFWAAHLDGATKPICAILWRLNEDGDLAIADIADTRLEIVRVALSLCDNDPDKNLWSRRLEILSGQHKSRG